MSSVGRAFPARPGPGRAIFKTGWASPGALCVPCLSVPEDDDGRILPVAPSRPAAPGIVAATIQAGGLLRGCRGQSPDAARDAGRSMLLARFPAPLLAPVQPRLTIGSATGCVFRSGSSRIACFVAPTTWGITTGPVLARLPSALARAGICAGSTTTTKRLAPAALSLPAALHRKGGRPGSRWPLDQRSDPLAATPHGNGLPARPSMRSRRPFETSTPIPAMASTMYDPCAGGLRRERSTHPFRVDGSAGGDPGLSMDLVSPGLPVSRQPLQPPLWRMKRWRDRSPARGENICTQYVTHKIFSLLTEPGDIGCDIVRRIYTRYVSHKNDCHLSFLGPCPWLGFGTRSLRLAGVRA